MTTATMDLTTATPSEIDTQLVEMLFQQARAKSRLNAASAAMLLRVAGQRAVEAHRIAQAAYAETSAAVEAMESEFDSRGGWTRAWLVQNANGHAHRTRWCSTCFPTTQFALLPAYSGADEDKIVADAGERACTVCYPTAPVDVLSRPTKMFGPDEVKAQEARVEREAAKVAREAKKVANGLTADGSEFVVTWPSSWSRTGVGTERFKTERAASMWYVESLCWNYNAEAEKAPAREQIAQAIATKYGKSVEQVRSELAIKVAAKRKREGMD